MTPICITPPTLEPLSLAEAKAWLKVDSTADDLLISALITAARVHVEKATRLFLLTQNWNVVADNWPCQRQWRGRIVDLPLSPVQSVASITLYDDYDVPTIINPATYRLDKSQANPRLIFSSVPPAPQRVAQGIEIALVNGFGDAAASVPEPLRQAMRLLVAYFYLNRGDATVPAPVSVQALIAPFRRLKVRV
jgi:uncharacterized phiE125 gp8 family phage protein